MKAFVCFTIVLIGLLTMIRAQDFPPELTQLKTPYVQAVTTSLEQDAAQTRSGKIAAER